MDDISMNIFFVIFTYDNSELRFVSNSCGGLLLVFEGRAYKLKHTRKQKKYCVDVPKNILSVQHVSIIKIRCRGAMCINLEVTDAISKKDHVQAASNKKRSRCQLCDVVDNKTALCKESYDTGQFDSKRDQFLNMTEGFCCATTADLFTDTCHNSCCFFSMPVGHTVLRKLPVEPSKLTSDGVLDLFLSVAQKRLDL
ncbi:hypothetical protein T10_9032 [Trichinella papuae]|uniref:Uncharacterized protein n=1 Tax=Trichinella papuae TaxID=268474 RepID=A0A0V1MTS7_9BILA|nr:hypothetical protein T10_9032 [Trichinella papuae]